MPRQMCIRDSWIATDPEVVAEYQRDPLCGQKFAVGAYHVLTSLVSDATDLRLARRVPHALPLLFVSGDQDPVGECGAGVHRAAEMYRKEMCIRDSPSAGRLRA